MSLRRSPAPTLPAPGVISRRALWLPGRHSASAPLPGPQRNLKALEDKLRAFAGKGPTAIAEVAALRPRLNSSFTLKSLIQALSPNHY